MKLLTVMVSQYNSGRWIRNRLDNLFKSTIINDIEIWCLNANSPDSLDHDVPKEYNVKYLKTPDRISVYEAWNEIIKNSNSLYITNANTDDIVAPNCYETLISALGNNEGFAYPSWSTTALENQQWPPREVDPSGRPGYYCGHIDKSSPGHFPLWSRSLHDKVGLFDSSYRALSDADFWARSYYLANAKFIWVDLFLGCYLWRNGQNLWNMSITPEEWGKYHESAQLYKAKAH